MPATALRAFRSQLVRLAAVVAAILPGFRHLALARPIRTYVIDLHADIASDGMKRYVQAARCDAGSFPEVKIRSP
ncbi:hypothetical protein GCM10007898_28980 [Dyella flagellata]|uniref:Uncharacterized protein n=1 Tax=Dyella flagellata TaxID=1867833 RepID=A0ABQ5XFM6_9GAMM|nr:hypothetical protein GCM10007898_28980 [Dyella flagellata]